MDNFRRIHGMLVNHGTKLEALERFELVLEILVVVL